MKHLFLRIVIIIQCISVLLSCSSDTGYSGTWDIDFQDSYGLLVLTKNGKSYTGQLSTLTIGDIPIDSISIVGNSLSASVDLYGKKRALSGMFEADKFTGYIATKNKKLAIVAHKNNDTYVQPKEVTVKHTLTETDLGPDEGNLDHQELIKTFDKEHFKRGERIYNANCINCHGTPAVEGSIPLSMKFWNQSFKYGNDPYAMYNTITRGSGAMPPQLTLTPQEKYDVILYIRENYIRPSNAQEYYRISTDYLAQLPKGTSKGPAIQPYTPWSDMDYGNFFINTYELADSKTGPARFHSEGPPPYPDENYLKNNFAYKGIAVRLDKGHGGVSKGNTWMIFDHDLMRVAGGWTGEGFIDWQGILLNDQHETYPRTIGKLHFETPVTPAWANPANGSFEDPRFKARDGRRFGPLPKKWAHYKGLYRYEDQVIISYTVGDANILERLGTEKTNNQTIFTRTLNISPSTTALKMRVAPNTTKVALQGSNASLHEANGFIVLNVAQGKAAQLKLFIADSTVKNLDDYAAKSAAAESLTRYTKGGKPQYEQTLSTTIITGNDNGPVAMDALTIPFDNPWKSRMKLSGVDFLKDPNKAVLCTTDGDVWLVTGLIENSGTLTWKRIGTGLFQPLGIKVVNDNIYVICRDQLVLLQDLNNDGETDFYQNFNNDHQVTDHFHEFAMGLQTDAEGNFYYAKSGRHAREALIPQHGTLLKVAKDGSKTDIIATGFRAANGVCINPDGSFIVTDQQGYWNPMNRVNWVDGKRKFYGNMWGYNPPKDSTSTAMEPPMIWIDMEFDRSPSELLWVDSKKWGSLNGSLLSFSYGYGKIQLVLPEEVNNQRQAAVIDLPDIKFLSGVMRGRFNHADGNLYACGMSAWGTSQMMKGGEFYRLRYTGKPLTTPIALNVYEDGVALSFANTLAVEKAKDLANFEVQTWNLKRSSKYGSERYDVQTLKITDVVVDSDGKTVKLILPTIKAVAIMTISYNLKDTNGNTLKGKVQNTIHNLKKI